MDLFGRRNRAAASAGQASMTASGESGRDTSDEVVGTAVVRIGGGAAQQVRIRAQRARVTAPSRRAGSGTTHANGVIGTRFYNAAATNRLTVGMPSVPATADQVVRRNLKSLVARSRFEVANGDYAKKAISIYQRNVVGPSGFVLKAQCMDGDKPDTEACAAIEQAWRAWGAKGQADTTGRLSFWGIQNMFLRSAAVDGEALIVEHVGKSAGNKWGYALQVMDSQLLDVEHNRQLENGNWVRMGIEYNHVGRPVAYWLIVPDERQGMLTYGYAGRLYNRYPAEMVIHDFDMLRTMQSRGLPWLSTGLLRLATLEGAEDAALVNFRMGASKLAWFTESEEGSHYEGEDQGVIDEDEPDRPRDRIVDADIGSFGELPKGVKLEKWEPQYPNGEYAPYVKRVLQGLSSGADVPYVSLSNDLEGVNYSSIRVGLLEGRAVFESVQTWMIECFMQRVFNTWLDVQLLNGNLVTTGGRLDSRKSEKYRAVTWQPNRWGWVDPMKEVQADALAVENGMASLTEVCRRRGRDFEDVVRERQREIQLMQDAGIPLPPKLNEQLVAASLKE